jgi:hypothetical protein
VKFFEIFFLQLFACLRSIEIFILNRQTTLTKKGEKDEKVICYFIGSSGGGQCGCR